MDLDNVASADVSRRMRGRAWKSWRLEQPLIQKWAGGKAQSLVATYVTW